MSYYSSVSYIYRIEKELNIMKDYCPEMTNFNKHQILNIFNNIKTYFGAVQFDTLGALCRYIDGKGYFKTRNNTYFKKRIDTGIQKVFLSNDDYQWNTFTVSYSTLKYPNIELMLTDSGLTFNLDHEKELSKADIEELRKLAIDCLSDTRIIKIVDQINIPRKNDDFN